MQINACSNSCDIIYDLVKSRTSTIFIYIGQIMFKNQQKPNELGPNVGVVR